MIWALLCGLGCGVGADAEPFDSGTLVAPPLVLPPVDALPEQVDLTRYDELRLKTLLEAHRRYTGSARASEVLGNWSDYRGRFVKVMPVEYRKALQKMQQRTQEEAGVSVAVGA